MDAKPKVNCPQIKLQELGVAEEESKATVDLLWAKDKPANVQFFVWQAISKGLPTGSWVARMSLPSECNCCARRIQETLEHYLSTCIYVRKVWRYTCTIRHALGLLEVLSWKEKITSIRPRIRQIRTYVPSRINPIASWDVLRAYTLWRIWCARCDLVFRAEPFNITQVYHNVWRDKVYATQVYHNAWRDKVLRGNGKAWRNH